MGIVAWGNVGSPTFLCVMQGKMLAASSWFEVPTWLKRGWEALEDGLRLPLAARPASCRARGCHSPVRGTGGGPGGKRAEGQGDAAGPASERSEDFAQPACRPFQCVMSPFGRSRLRLPSSSQLPPCAAHHCRLAEVLAYFMLLPETFIHTRRLRANCRAFS